MAVKLLKSREGSAHAEALRREMRLGPILAGHPNIVAVDHVESVDGALHLEMEWVRGPSLADVMSYRREHRQGPLPPSVVVPWAISVLEALDWAGSRVAPSQPSSFVHRDIKPANLLLDTDGRLRITDFGIARAEAELGFQTTTTGIVKGSPRYMAPEILAERNVDARADQFSLGAVIYELLTGETLYTARDLANTLIEALEADVEPRLDAWEDGPLRLKKALRTMLAKDPRHRFTNHRVAADSLRALRPEGPSLQGVLPQLLSAIRTDETSPAAPAITDLPELIPAADRSPTATDDILLGGNTVDLPSLEIDTDLPPVSALLADRDRGDTVPLRRGAPGDPATVVSVTQQVYDRELIDQLLEPDSEDTGVTKPIPVHPEDEEETVVKSLDELARELGMLEGHSLDEHTVASEEVPDPSTGTDVDLLTDRGSERTVVLPDVQVAPPPPPRSGYVQPTPAPTENAGGLPWWAYAGVGCSVLGLALAVIVAGVAVGLFLASR